jgi:hypothetical protein
MKKSLAKSVALALIGSLVTVGSAMALSITLDDGNDGVNLLTIVDQSASDENNLAGLVQFNGFVGNWSTNISVGASYPTLGTISNPMLDLLSMNLDYASPYAGTIMVSVTDTYTTFGALDADITGFVAAIGGTTSGSVNFFANINGVELAVNWADMLKPGGGAFAGSQSLSLADFNFNSNDIWDMTLTAVVSHQGPGYTTFDASVAPVPEPATVLLFGVGLVGLVGYSRRKDVKKRSAC